MFAGFGFAGVILLLGAASGLVVVFGGLAVMAALALIAWRWPVPAAIFLAAFTPVNRFVILLVFHFTHVGILTKLTQLWKDGLVAVLFARVVYDALFSTDRRRIRYLDLLVAAFLGLSTVYVFYPGTAGADLFTRVTGFRTDAFFLLAYFVGRGLRLQRKHVRWLLVAIIPGSVLVAAVAAWQFFLPQMANRVFETLEFQQFIQLQGGLGDLPAARERGLVGVSLARASSLLLGDLALAFYQILLVALAAALFYGARSARRRIITASFLALMLATLTFTVTRSAVLAIIPVLVLTAIFARSLGRLVTIIAVCAATGLAVVSLSGTDLAIVQQLLNPGEASARAHVDAAARSLQIIEEEPLGRGLGTAGTIGQRFNKGESITNESWYLQLATEMGVFSALLYLTMIVVVVFTGFATYLRIRDFWLRTLTLGIAGGAIGFLVIGNFLHAWENTVLSMLVWLLAGIAVRARDLDTLPS